ncbi:MAG TPA: MaoC family dehydratase [Gaiellaceae bacterium]|nr:MaoC family dehydratase [Gaiellaceae bacterium]
MPTLTKQQLRDARDLDLGASDWVRIEQKAIDAFAEATNDHNWIHVDQERAAEGPFGMTIGHGYLSLSLIPGLLYGMMNVTDAAMGLNYGVEKVRFTSPVPVNSEVRLKARVVSSEPRGDGILYRLAAEIEIKGQEKPAMVGEVLYLIF